MIFYVYRHVTADEGIPFYIGKGSKNRANVTAMKYIPKDLRQESRSANGRLNSIRMLGKKPWNYGKGNSSN